MRTMLAALIISSTGAAHAQAPPDWDQPDPCARKRAFVNALREPEKSERAPELAECERLVEQRKRLPAIQRDKKQMAVVLGSILCALDFGKRQALDEIAKEKKYAKVGGVINKAKLYAQQQRIRRADEQTKIVRDKMKNPLYAGVVPLQCKSEKVQHVLHCHDTPETEGCGQSESDYAVFIDEFVNAANDEDR